VLLAALLVGAGTAGVFVITRPGQPVARADQAPPTQNALPAPQPSTLSSTSTTPPPPPVSDILPFNVKLSSKDIPTADGGVRIGGCSGSLVAPQWVVTAGHCFHDTKDARVGGKPPYTMSVTVGKLKDSDPGGRTAQVVDVRQSPVNDLAVVKLDRAVDDVQPLALATKKPTVGQRLHFAGWGSLSPTVIVQSDHLKRGDFTVAKILQTTLEMSPVVTRTVENSPCKDDSGAPFFTSDDNKTGTLVAIVNTGPTCPQPGREIVARVDAVAGWIKQQTGGSSG
jgi:secreted trypsin-like serine protease